MRVKINTGTVVAFLILVLAVWAAFLAVPQPAQVRLGVHDGGVDLSEADLTGTIYFYHDYWDSWPEQLYTPEDFENGAVREPPAHLTNEDYRVVEYATHRVRVALPPGETYGLSLKSSDYSMRIYIDGELFDTVGNPGGSKDTTIPRTAERTYFFIPESESTTIIVQAANWVHKEGAYPPNFYVGAAQDILRHHDYNRMMTFLITGGLLTAFLYHLGLFVLNRSRRPVLVFALCCLLLAFMTNNLFSLFSGEYNWYAAIGFEYIVHFLTFAMLVLFLAILFPRLLHRYVTRVYYVMAGVFILFTFIFPPEIYSNLLIVFDGASVFMIAYILIRLIMQLGEKKIQNFLAFIGIFIICLFGVNDILYQNGISFLGNIAGQAFTTPIAMLFFVFCYGLVISIDYAETEKKMLDAERLVREAEARYNALLEERPSPAAPADYGLSQRETDVLWLVLDGKTRQEIADILGISMGTINTYFARIYQKTNTNNVGGLFKIFGLSGKE